MKKLNRYHVHGTLDVAAWLEADITITINATSEEAAQFAARGMLKVGMDVQEIEPEDVPITAISADDAMDVLACEILDDTGE